MIRKSIVVVLALIILLAGVSIPFLFESPSMYYKTGIDKLLLRMGKVLGIIATVLIFYQLILISRFKSLEKAFKINKLFTGHRLNGLIVLGAAIIHPILILGADHFVFFPFELKYWPEFAGIGLFVVLSLFVLVSHWRQKINLDYKIWKLIHKSFAPVILVLLFIHIINVSKTFESGIPLYALIVLFVLSLFLIVRKYLKKP